MPTVHIESKRDEIADIVLMPGDLIGVNILLRNI